MIYIFDIDGTLSDLSHRLHLISDGQKDWDAFFDACSGDRPINRVIATCQMLHKAEATIVLLSGRSDAVRQKTVDWLNEHRVPFHALYMRKAGDHRQDDVVKAELFERMAQEWDLKNLLGVFEDRNQVVEMYRKRGLQVFQVADGNF